MKPETILREVVRQAKEKPHGLDAGWVSVKIPKISSEELCLFIQQANQRGLVKGFDVSSFQYPNQWRILDVTAEGLQYLEETKTSQKFKAAVWAGILALVGFIAWVIPVLISWFKK